MTRPGESATGGVSAIERALREQTERAVRRYELRHLRGRSAIDELEAYALAQLEKITRNGYRLDILLSPLANPAISASYALEEFRDGLLRNRLLAPLVEDFERKRPDSSAVPPGDHGTERRPAEPDDMRSEVPSHWPQRVYDVEITLRDHDRPEVKATFTLERQERETLLDSGLLGDLVLEFEKEKDGAGGSRGDDEAVGG